VNPALPNRHIYNYLACLERGTEASEIAFHFRSCITMREKKQSPGYLLLLPNILP
jgi:hypothetical protein